MRLLLPYRGLSGSSLSSSPRAVSAAVVPARSSAAAAAGRSSRSKRPCARAVVPRPHGRSRGAGSAPDGGSRSDPRARRSPTRAQRVRSSGRGRSARSARSPRWPPSSSSSSYPGRPQTSSPISHPTVTGVLGVATSRLRPSQPSWGGSGGWMWRRCSRGEGPSVARLASPGSNDGATCVVRSPQPARGCAARSCSSMTCTRQGRRSMPPRRRCGPRARTASTSSPSPARFGNLGSVG
jgi:hypothetical protein